MFAIGSSMLELDSFLLKKLCENKLVVTKEVLVEVPVAFPIRDELASGMSYWIHEAKRNGLTMEKVKEKFKVQDSW